jgi:hypothetical protein
MTISNKLKPPDSRDFLGLSKALPLCKSSSYLLFNSRRETGFRRTKIPLSLYPNFAIGRNCRMIDFSQLLVNLNVAGF